MEAGGCRLGVLAHNYVERAGLVARQHDADPVAQSAELVGEAEPELGHDAGTVGAGGCLAVVAHLCLLCQWLFVWVW